MGLGRTQVARATKKQRRGARSMTCLEPVCCQCHRAAVAVAVAVAVGSRGLGITTDEASMRGRSNESWTVNGLRGGLCSQCRLSSLSAGDDLACGMDRWAMGLRRTRSAHPSGLPYGH